MMSRVLQRCDISTGVDRKIFSARSFVDDRDGQQELVSSNQILSVYVCIFFYTQRMSNAYRLTLWLRRCSNVREDL